MASPKHQELSSFIKNVHLKLRTDYHRSMDEDEVWEKHCQDKARLKAYSQAMYKLATSYWEKFCANNPCGSRIHWVRKTCNEYFYGTGLKRSLEKDRRTLEWSNCNAAVEIFAMQGKLRMLDVGSCYNPYKDYDEFDVVAIDLAPAVDSVLQCDFLKANICKELRVDCESCVVSLPKESFDVVTFCLLLEYLPSPQQRFLCCQKAYKLLQTNGLLMIVTPDSRHQHYNSRLMRQWKVGLGLLGFSRAYYEKLPNLHAMAFRKLPCTDMAKIYLKKDLDKLGLKDDLSNEHLASLLAIPQDSVVEKNEYKNEEQVRKERDQESEYIADNFCHLPTIDL